MNHKILIISATVFLAGVIIGRGFTAQSKINSYKASVASPEIQFEKAEINELNGPFKELKLLATRYEIADEKFTYSKISERTSDSSSKFRVYGSVNGRPIILYFEVNPNQTPE